MTEETTTTLLGRTSDRLGLFASNTKILYYLVPVVTLVLLRYLFPAILADDAYISFKVAVNTASGWGMVFNPGENTYISTSPLWVLLLTSFRLLLGDVILAAITLGFIFELLLVMSIVHFSLSTRLGGKVGMLTALLLITNPVFLFTSFSGMELPLYLLVIVLTALFLSQGRYTIAMACGACAVWVRFDGLVVYGVTIAIFLWLERHQFRKQPVSMFVKTIPSITIVLGYGLFGTLFFETWVPMSVQRKALTSPDLFSPDWFQGSRVVAREFVHGVIGKSSVWYTHTTPFIIMAIPFVVGGSVQVLKRRTSSFTLLAITLAYVVAFVASGNAYAQYFPWYFVPILPAVYLVCSVGIVWLLSAVSKLSPVLQKAERVEVLLGLVVVCWLAVSIVSLHRDAISLTKSKDERERVYATAGVWAGKHIGRDVRVAANEIGAVGFFLPPDASLLDMFGLLRRKDTLRDSFVLRVRQEMPHVIFTRMQFSYKKLIVLEMENQYHWVSFKDLDIGIRSDLVASLQPQLSDLDTIYEELDVDSEYRWGLDFQ